jgi:hypothetical protein
MRRGAVTTRLAVSPIHKESQSMAEVIHVAGPVHIQFASPEDASSLQDLGFSLSGVEITEKIHFHEVHGDENGGDHGPPIDVQYMGEVHTIRMTLTKWDEDSMAQIRAGMAGGTQGVPGAAGSLYFAGNKAWRLVLNCPNGPRNYPRVIFQEPKHLNKGTKHSQALIVATAHKNGSGVLWNSSIS